jgi:hypothetical protein
VRRVFEMGVIEFSQFVAFPHVRESLGIQGKSFV